MKRKWCRSCNAYIAHESPWDQCPDHLCNECWARVGHCVHGCYVFWLAVVFTLVARLVF